MSDNKYSQLVVVINEDVAYASLLYLHGDKIDYSGKQDIVTNISFEAIIPSIKKNLFYQHMLDF